MEVDGHQYKLVRRDERRFDAHFLTFSCWQRKPLLASDTAGGLLSTALSRAIVRHDFDLIAFVFMPEHVHLLVQPRSHAASVSKLLWAIKRPMAYRAKRILGLSETREFHFWQAGPGFDSNIRDLGAVAETARYIHLNPVRRGLASTAESYRWSSARMWIGQPNEWDRELPQIRSTAGRASRGTTE